MIKDDFPNDKEKQKQLTKLVNDANDIDQKKLNDAKMKMLERDAFKENIKELKTKESSQTIRKMNQETTKVKTLIPDKNNFHYLDSDRKGQAAMDVNSKFSGRGSEVLDHKNNYLNE